MAGSCVLAFVLETRPFDMHLLYSDNEIWMLVDAHVPGEIAYLRYGIYRFPRNFLWHHLGGCEGERIPLEVERLNILAASSVVGLALAGNRGNEEGRLSLIDYTNLDKLVVKELAHPGFRSGVFLDTKGHDKDELILATVGGHHPWENQAGKGFVRFWNRDGCQVGADLVTGHRLLTEMAMTIDKTIWCVDNRNQLSSWRFFKDGYSYHGRFTIPQELLQCELATMHHCHGLVLFDLGKLYTFGRNGRSHSTAKSTTPNSRESNREARKGALSQVRHFGFLITSTPFRWEVRKGSIAWQLQEKIYGCIRLVQPK